MKPRLNNLKSRLALAVFLPAVLISLVDLAFGYRDADQVATLVQEQLLKGAAKTISEQLERVEDHYEVNIPPAAFELFANDYKDHIYFTIRSENGRLIAGNEELLPYTGPLEVEQGRYFLSMIRDEPVRVIAFQQPIANGINNETSITQVAQTLNSHHAFRSSLFANTIREHLILLAIVVVGLVIALRWMMQPLVLLGQRLRERPTGSLESFSVAESPSELEPVIAAINDYVLRLNKTLSSYEQFVANTAHQLRTWFSIINSQVDFAIRNFSGAQEQRQHPTQASPPITSALQPGASQQQVMNDIKTTLAQGNKVINQLLILAAAEQNHASAQSGRPVQLADIAKQVVVELALLAHQKAQDLGIEEMDEQLMIQANPYLLRELIANIVDNAIQHIQSGGMITLSVVREAEHALLSVTDNGPGIELALREKVFERFYRINQEKSDSSGLGLAIAKSICDSLSAKITLRNAEPPPGLVVEIRFPLLSGHPEQNS